MVYSRRMHAFTAAALLTTLTACSGGGNSVAPRVTPAGAVNMPIEAAAIGASPAFAPRQVAAIIGGETALSADSLPGDHDASNNFIDSIGVNTKLNIPAYSNYAGVKSALLSLGVRHIRDAFSTQNLNNYENNLNDLAASGVHSVLGLTIDEDANNVPRLNVTGSSAAAYLQAGHFAKSIEAIEGINEPDVNQGSPGSGPPVGWVALTQSSQKDLYTSVQKLTSPAKRLPVFGPSVATSRAAQAGNLSAYLDYGNFHDYSGGYDLPGKNIASAMVTEQSLSGAKPMVATENGYSTGTTGQGLPDLIMLDYTQRLFFKQFTNGVKRTLWYELLDEDATPNDYWKQAGLLNSSLAPKPAYVGLKNIIALLKDQTNYQPRTALNYSFGGQIQFENIEHLLLQKNDGSFYLVVWRDVSEWTPANNGSPGSLTNPTPLTVTNSLNFIGSYVKSITDYKEDYTGAMLSTPIAVSSGNTAQITISARPAIYKIVLGTAPVAPTAPVISSPAAHWSLDEAGGTIAADSVSSAGNMTVPSGTQSSWLSGVYGTGICFAGTQASTSAAVINTSQSYSATAWIQMNSLTGYQAAVAVNGAKQAAFAIDFTPASNISFTTYTQDSASTLNTRVGSAIIPVIGKWYAVAATYNASNRLMSLYVNGTLAGTATAAAVFNGTGGVEIGSMLQGGVGHYQWLNGSVDEVNLYARAITPAEIKTLAGN